MADTIAAPTAGTSRPAAAKPKAGVPVWRVGKPDSILAAAMDTARDALAAVARPEDIGAHLAAKSEGERVVTHLFESRLAGYRGWQWFVTVARISRSRVATVSEIGLVPSEDSVLAPEWVPWSERVRPEEREAEGQDSEPVQEEPVQEEPVQEGDSAHDGAPAASADASPEAGETED